METIEKTAETVEEAIAAGLQELGVAPHEVMVEVLEEPTRGLFGLGARPARVRLVLMTGRRQESSVQAPTPAKPSSAPAPARDDAERDDALDLDDADDADQDSHFDTMHPDSDEAVEDPLSDYVALSDDEADEDARTGKAILLDLLERMHMSSDVTIFRSEAPPQGEEKHWLLNITGAHVNRLIGRRGETLSSLQYVTRLIVSRRLQRRANLVVDAGEYKSRRSQRLRALANRMADQASQQNRKISLEPMPPHERRIIHLTLRARQDVETRSEGEGRGRKVTIVPSR